MMRYIPEAIQSRIKPNYDYMGRRYTKKVTSNGTVTLHQRYIYRGYLQIACVDLTRSEHPALWYITWDPTEPVATRPLAIQKNATWYTYSHDLTKNVTELYQSDGLIATTYDYSPYGAAAAEGIDQPLQWSSEYHDAELALTYYNYRHYNPTDGRWINRDPIQEEGGLNWYGFVRNSTIFKMDYVGLYTTSLHSAIPVWLAQGRTFAEIAVLIGLSIADIEVLVGPQPPEGDFCEALKQAVRDAKKKTGEKGGCQDHKEFICDELLERIEAWENSVDAKMILNKLCFKGGDDGHIKRAGEDKKVAEHGRNRYQLDCEQMACNE